MVFPLSVLMVLFVEAREALLTLRTPLSWVGTAGKVGGAGMGALGGRMMTGGAPSFADSEALEVGEIRRDSAGGGRKEMKGTISSSVSVSL